MLLDDINIGHLMKEVKCLRALGFGSSLLIFVKGALLEDICYLHSLPRPLWSMNMLIKA